MKLIVKQKPTSLHHKLIDFKRDINCKYENLTKELKAELLSALLNEQGFICAYCMQKINDTNAQIEHVIGQNYTDKDGNNIGEENQLNYDNLIAVCQGKSCEKGEHCDSNRSKFQKYRPLFVSPLKNRIMPNIKFTEKGLIYYKDFLEIQKVEELKEHSTLDEDSNIKYDLQKVLNLNCKNLKDKRIYLINALKKLTNNWSNQERIKRQLEKYSKKSSNEYEEMSQVAIYFLEKKLKS